MGESKVTDKFQAVIREYCESIAEIDDAFAARYESSEKSIEECCNYILNQVEQSGRQGFADEEIFGMAIHYYQEDNLGEIKESSIQKIIVNREIQLSEEEKEQARREVIERLKQEEINRVREQERKTKEAAKKRAEEAKKKAEEAGELSLFGGLFDETEE